MSDHCAFGNSHTEFVSYLHTWTRSGTWDYWVRANSASSHKMVTTILVCAWPQQCWKSCANISNFVALPFSNHGMKEMLPRSCLPKSPPPPPEMTCSFLIQLVFCKKKTMWFIGVEVEQETSAPPPKKNPGSASELVVGQQYCVRDRCIWNKCCVHLHWA